MRDLFNALRRNAALAGGDVAFSSPELTLTWQELAAKVASLAGELQQTCSAGQAIGLLGSNNLDWVTGQLAGWYAGLTVVPLPPFFPPPYLKAILHDAGVRCIMATEESAGRAGGFGLPVIRIGAAQPPVSPDLLPPRAGGGQIVYTSGSTGQPKGVLLRGRQLLSTARSLVRATEVCRTDSYLSAMPLALLLETICCVVMPILARGSAYLDPALAAAFTSTDGDQLARGVAARRPTCLTLTPHLLAGWVASLAAGGPPVPASVRFVAVGGAAAPYALIDQAWAQGIPAHQGYGLTECGSVVTLNRPGEGRGQSVGRALSGLKVEIVDGEIVVSGPSVMEGYVGRQPAESVWHTGDLGEIDSDGRLTVFGRKDNLIVTPAGRNVSPEWIEALIASDPKVAACFVIHAGGPDLAAFIIPSARSAAWFAGASPEEIDALVANLCRGAPDYAVPRGIAVVSQAELAAAGVLTGNGRFRRQAAGPLLRKALMARAALQHA